MPDQTVLKTLFFLELIFFFLFLVPTQGFKQQALAVSTDPEHRFELALQLGELKIAYQLAVEAEVRLHCFGSETD